MWKLGPNLFWKWTIPDLAWLIGSSFSWAHFIRYRILFKLLLRVTDNHPILPYWQKKKKIKIMISTPLTSKTSITSEGPSRVKKISSNLRDSTWTTLFFGSQLLRDEHFRAVCLLLNSDRSPKFSDSEDISSPKW